jgi:hypothetical protein
MLTLMRIAGWIVMDPGRLLPRPSAGATPRSRVRWLRGLAATYTELDFSGHDKEDPSEGIRTPDFESLSLRQH